MRRSWKLGPFRWNFTERGYSSWSFQLGRFTWNSRRGKSVDLPGPMSWHDERRR
jgi:hypothetical protein